MTAAYLAVNEQLEQGDGLLCAVLIHARHVEIIKKHHELLAHNWSISVLGTLLSPVLQ